MPSSPNHFKHDAKKPSGTYGSLANYFKKNTVPYQTIKLETLKKDLLLNTVLVQTSQGVCMVIAPNTRLLDYTRLAELLEGDFSVISNPKEIATALSRKPDALKTGVLPFPDYYGLSAIFDSSIRDFSVVQFLGEEAKTAFEMTIDSFRGLHSQDMWNLFSDAIDIVKEEVSSEHEDSSGSLSTAFMKIRMKHRIEDVIEMPAIPVIANEILKLRLNTNAGAVDLASLVEKDPSLAAQVVSWGSSPYYGCPVKITSVIEAINRVLGFDLVMNLALGIAISCTLRAPPGGPLGLHAHWRHALYSATLVENIIREMPQGGRPPRGLAYLSGLLQNFGHLLLGHLFVPQFKLLNHMVELNPQFPITVIEEQVLNVDHTEFGAWLMQAWHMPEELISAVRWHHTPNYSGEHCVYAQLVWVSNTLLKTHNIGEAKAQDIPDSLLDSLKLSVDALTRATDKLWENSSELDNLVGHFAN